MFPSEASEKKRLLPAAGELRYCSEKKGSVKAFEVVLFVLLDVL